MAWATPAALRLSLKESQTINTLLLMETVELRHSSWSKVTK
jgi:hypothetical protein